MPDYPDFLATWQVICARAWTDPKFKRELRRDPDGVLASHGFDLPEGMHFHVVENDDKTMNLVLPASPNVVAKVSPAGHRTVSQYQASCV